jgi:hypothetical protein
VKKASFLLRNALLYILKVFPVVRFLYFDPSALVEPGKCFNGIGKLADLRFAQFYRFKVEIMDGQYPLFAIGF